ncbi:MAG: histidine phosphatase family protein [Atribacterota bacterium]
MNMKSPLRGERGWCFLFLDSFIITKKENANYMPIKLMLIRHGESDGNVQRMFCGFKDVELTKKGIYQAERLAYRLKELQVDAVYCSDLKRAKHTAEIVFGSRGIDIIPSSNLREMNFGIWEGYTFEEVKSKYGYGDEFFSWLENINTEASIPQGESLVDLNNRVMTELNKILKEYNKLDIDETIAMVCHGGPIRVILCNVLNIELKYMWNIEQYSAALNMISYYNHKAFVDLVNDTSHLEDWWESGLIQEKRDE